MVNVTPGPYGDEVVPAGTITTVSGTMPAPTSSLNYPSIILAISATPLLTPVSENKGNDTNLADIPESIQKVTGDNVLQWMDITFTLTGYRDDPSNCSPAASNPPLHALRQPAKLLVHASR
jgi:hypothetical protein